MHFFGLLIYIGIPVLTYVFPPARALVEQCYTLSPEITVLIGLTYFYPLSNFIYNLIRKQADVTHLAHFSSQVKLASSLAVSFGLIGTFIGLSDMIAGIAAGMGAEGDFSEKMEALLSSIGTALDSMSFAFLTSILGVSCSVGILVASNYLYNFFEKELVHGESSADSNGKGGSIDGLTEEQQQAINDNFRQVHKAIDDTLHLINSKDKVWTDLFTLLENNSGSTVVKEFSAGLEANNQLIQQQSTLIERQSELTEQQSLKIQQIHNDQSTMYQKMEASLNDYSHYMQQQTHSMVNAITNMASEIDKMGYLIEQASHRTNEAISQNGDVFEHVSASFNQALSNTNDQLKGVANILHDIRVATAVPLEESLNEALRDNAFHLVFQPQFDKDKAVIGAESYIRWIEPVRGLISNAKLFSVAKKEGLAVQLEFWVMSNTIRQVSEWQQQGMWEQDWTVSINATSDVLLAPNFITEVEKMIKQFDVMPGSIAFEVTEDVLMQHDAQAKDKVRQLRNMGIKLYIDNFGTGYTNIGHLSQFQPNRLKLARAIVNNLTNEDQSGIAVVRSVMSLAQQLGITVSADGVETQEQFDLLLAEGCHLFQGWYFEKPLKVEEFEQKLSSTEAIAEKLNRDDAIEDATIVADEQDKGSEPQS